MKAELVVKNLKRLGSPKKAKASLWFFKTEKGEYGYGDKFFGVTVPEQRQIAEKYSTLSLKEISKLLKNRVHECRLTALLILVAQYKNATEREKEKIVKFYLKNTKYINNWDLVDLSAYQILGEFYFKRDRLIIYKLARSKNLWERRIAILTTFYFIREKDFKDSLKIATILLGDKHDLIHKAVGWMLREVGKRSIEVERSFLDKYASKMSRTTLRYAIERFPEKERKAYLAR